MTHYDIPLSSPVTYHMSGKFEALSDDWKHYPLILEDYELFVVTDGVIYLEYDRKKYCIKSGEMLLLPPAIPPDNIRKGYKGAFCSFYWLHFGLENSLNDDASILKLPSTGRLNYPEKIIILMKQIQDASREKAPAITLDYMTSALLCKLYDDINAASDAVNIPNRQLYNDIVDYIRDNINTPIKVYEIADRFGYNEKYLSHMFKVSSGETLKQFILRMKIEEANLLLTDSNITVSEISAMLGFSDNHNFMRCYKKLTGLSPTEYRNAFSKRVLNH